MRFLMVAGLLAAMAAPAMGDAAPSSTSGSDFGCGLRRAVLKGDVVALYFLEESGSYFLNNGPGNQGSLNGTTVETIDMVKPNRGRVLGVSDHFLIQKGQSIDVGRSNDRYTIGFDGSVVTIDKIAWNSAGVTAKSSRSVQPDSQRRNP